MYLVLLYNVCPKMSTFSGKQYNPAKTGRTKGRGLSALIEWQPICSVFALLCIVCRFPRDDPVCGTEAVQYITGEEGAFPHLNRRCLHSYKANRDEVRYVMKTRRITCARHWIALLLCFGMLLPAMSATVFAADGDFAEGRSITYYAKASENELFGMLADYNADGTGLGKWNQVLTDENEIYYSQKTVPGADHQPYCAFQFGTEAIDWGIGEEDIQDTLCLTKTWLSLVLRLIAK